MRIYYLSFLFLFLAFESIAQTGDVRGFVYEEETSEPLPYSSVYLKGTTHAAQTNLDGFFSLTQIPVGEYTLLVTSIGYDTISQPITIKSSDIITKKFFLKKSVILFKEVEISAENEQKRNDVMISVTKITPKEIRQVPTIGGEPDLAQYLAILPGVISSGDQGGQLYIRGGTPIQNEVLLDGMIVYNPFHSIGFFSVLDPDIIRGADVYTGAFPAEYGGRLSSVIDVTTRDGNKKRLAGKVSATTFTSKAILEGPLKKQDDEGGGSSSFLVEGKTCYLDKTSPTLYHYVDTAGLPFSFTDLYGKISLNGANGSKVNFFGFNFSDRVKYQHIADLHWNNLGFGSNFVLIPGSTSALIDGHFAYSKYNISLSEADGLPRTSDISGVNFGLDFTYFFGKDELKYGLNIVTNRTNFDFYNSVGLEIAETQNSTDLSGYLKYKKIIGNLVIEPGVRLDYYASFPEMALEPRLGIKYNITDYLRFKAAGGFYSQNLLAAASDRDVVNLFYGFLTGTVDIPDSFNHTAVTSKIQSATHGVAGFEIDLPKRITLNIEGYYKDFTQLENTNPNKIFDTDNNFIIETGKAYGVDFLAKWEYKNLYLWLGYSLAYVTRFDGTQEYTPVFDRRHNINFVASYTWGKNKEWEANLRWNFGSPFPFYRTQGNYEQLVFNNGLFTDIIHQNGQLSQILETYPNGRLSYYHRLDASVKRAFKVSKNSSLDVAASVTNIYDRNNIFYVNRITDQRIYQLPILPSVGVSLTF